jgi:hypothetical protein
MFQPNDAVTDLSAYRRQQKPENSNEESRDDAQRVIAELAYHLLKAIQAVKKLPH